MKKIIFTLLILTAFKFASAECISDFFANTTTTSNVVGIENVSTAGHSSSFWDFGDGTFSNNNSSTPFNITYSQPGFYLVKLTVNYNDTCYSTISKLIEVGNTNNLCNSSFEYVVNGNDVSFTDMSMGSPNHWLWEFGDGTTSNLQNPPLHSYPSYGYYNVRLLVFNIANSCMDIYHEVISVGTNNIDCRADFNFSSDFVTDSIRFYDNSLGNNLTHFNWNFGDNTTSSEQNPKKKYSQSGFYNVCLSVWDDAHSCYNTGCQFVPSRTNSNTCNASFNFWANASRLVTFRDNSTGNPTSWSWDFGDGATATSQNVTRLYSTAGLYLVHLKASNANSSSDYVQLINVGVIDPGLKGMFGYLINNNYHHKAATPVDFKGSSLGDPSHMIWHFGDGDADSSSCAPYHVYADSGMYHACVTVVNNNTNQTDTYCQDIHVIADGINEITENKISLSTSPNPFSTSTNITYFIPKPTDVSLIVYDLIGNKKAILVNKNQQQGIYTYIWNKKALNNGIYLLEFKTSNGTIVKKITIVE